MVPTLEVGQRVLVNRIGNRFSDPEVGDIVVFHPPAGAETDDLRRRATRPHGPGLRPSRPQKAGVNFIKRVVAGPGDTHLDRRRPRRSATASAQKEPTSRPCGGGRRGCDFPTPITIPPGHCFMMGDNRGESDDSRFWGPVPKKWIIGGAFATYWPPKRIGLL